MKQKIKTNRSAAKRFKRVGDDKFKYEKANGSHILTSKSTKRKRSLRKGGIISKANHTAISRLLPNS